MKAFPIGIASHNRRERITEFVMKTQFALAALLISFTLASAAPEAAATRSAADLLPASTVAYLEVERPQDLIQFVFDSSLRKKMDELGAFKEALQSDGFRKFQDVLQIMENKSGLKWRPTLETLTDGGICLALDAQTEGLVLLLKSKDAGTLRTTIDTFLELARTDAENKGKPDPFPARTYREIETYKIKDAGFAVVGPWFILVNKKELGKTIVDNLLDGSENALANHAEFTALQKSASSRTLWAAVNLAKLREAGVAPHLFTGKTPNPGVELLLGGIIETLRNAPHASAELDLSNPDRIGLSLALPHDSRNIPEARRYFFGPEGDSVAEAPLHPPNTLLTMTTYRDVAGMWLAADDLFNENMAAKLAKQDSDFGVFFNGKNFGSDILGQLQPNIQLVLTRPEFTEGPVPAVQLPAGALIARVKPGGELPRQLKVAFQTLISFLNISGTQQGRPLLELATQNRDGATIVSADYLIEPEDQNKKQAETFYNFSPSVVQIDDYFMLCSTRRLAEQLADEAAHQSSRRATTANTQITLDAATLARTLDANRQNLIAHNQLQKGHSLEEATHEIESLLSLVNLFKDADLSLTTREEKLKVNLTLNLAQETRAAK